MAPTAGVIGAIRLAWKLQRFELVALVGGTLVLVAASLLLAWQLGSTREELESCYRTAPDSGVSGWPCRTIDAWVNHLTNVGAIFSGITATAPFLVGVFLGVPIVAREIEQRTAPFAWSVSRSRRRWLVLRVLPPATIVVATLLLLGQASEAALLAAPAGEIDFRHFAMHGPLLAVRGLAAFAIGLLVGTLLGRALPAILLTGFAIVLLVIGLHVARYELMRTEAVWVDLEDGFSYSYVHESGFRDGDSGAIIGFQEAVERYPQAFAEEGEQTPPGTTMVMKVNPVEQYPSFVARECAALGITTVIVAAGTASLVRRRRPG